MYHCLLIDNVLLWPTTITLFFTAYVKEGSIESFRGWLTGMGNPFFHCCPSEPTTEKFHKKNSLLISFQETKWRQFFFLQIYSWEMNIGRYCKSCAFCNFWSALNWISAVRWGLIKSKYSPRKKNNWTCKEKTSYIQLWFRCVSL